MNSKTTPSVTFAGCPLQMPMSALGTHTVATVLLAWQLLAAHTTVWTLLAPTAVHVQLDSLWTLMDLHALVGCL